MGMKILIVDDSRTVHGFIEKTLSMAGIEYEIILHAFNGEEGLSVLSRNPVDVVFSDIHMPVMGGIEMIEHMKKDESLKEIPIIIVSTEGSKVRIDHLQEMGITAFLRKPFTPEQIRELIHSVEGRHDAT